MSASTQGFHRDVFHAAWRARRVWMLQLIANAVIMVAFFYWLKIHDTSVGMFAVSAFAGAAILFATLSLHGATFHYFRRPLSGLSSSFRLAASHSFSLLMWALLFGLILWLTRRLWTYDEQIGGWARHAMPTFLRSHVSPRSVITAATWIVDLFVFVLWPIVFLPVGSYVASYGWRGFFRSSAIRSLAEVQYWILYIACFVVGGYVPYKLAYLTPTKASSLTSQTASMVLRLGVAYLLMVTAWMIVCAAIARAGDEDVVSDRAVDPVEAAPSLR